MIPVVKLNNGRPFPLLGLGTWAYEQTGERDVLEQVVYDAICAGIRHIDTAWYYRVEKQVGAAVRRAISDGVVKRDDMTVVTKIWYTNMSRDRLLAQAKESQENLSLGAIDVLLVHWPVPMKPDSDQCDDSINIYTETWPAMEKCIEQGIAKSIGLSNFTPSQIETLVSKCTIKPVVNQVESHPLLPQNKILNTCRKHKIVMTAFMPFGGSPKPIAGPNGTQLVERDVRKALFNSPVIKSIADKHKKSVAQVLLKFHVQRGVAVIPKSVSKHRIVENMQIFDFELTPDDMKQLASLETGERVCFMPGMTKSKYNPFTD